MLLYGDNTKTDYIRRAFFDGNASFVQMGTGVGGATKEEMLQYIKESMDTHEITEKPQVGQPYGLCN